MTQDIQDTQTMIVHGWEPIEYRSPAEIDGDYVFIRWNGIKEGWEVLGHPTVDENTIYPTAPDALRAIHAAKPE